MGDRLSSLRNPSEDPWACLGGDQQPRSTAPPRGAVPWSDANASWHASRRRRRQCVFGHRRRSPQPRPWGGLWSNAVEAPNAAATAGFDARVGAMRVNGAPGYLRPSAPSRSRASRRREVGKSLWSSRTSTAPRVNPARGWTPRCPACAVVNTDHRAEKSGTLSRLSPGRHCDGLADNTVQIQSNEPAAQLTDLVRRPVRLRRSCHGVQ